METQSTLRNENLGYTETISFYHHQSAHAIVENSLYYTHANYENNELMAISDVIAIPFLLTQEFIYTLDSPIEHDRLINFSDQGNKMISNLIIGRIKQFVLSRNDNLKRIFLENVPCYIECISLINITNFLLPALAKIVDDKIELRIKFLKVSPNMIVFFKNKGKEGYEIMVNNMMRLFNELYTPKSILNKEMKELLYENYLKIAQCLTTDDLGNFILAKIISISHESEQLNSVIELENSLLIIRLIGGLGEYFGEKYCEQFIIPHLKILNENSSPVLREAVCGILPLVAHSVSFNILCTQINKHFYLKLSKDENENVRKKAVNILPSLMKIYHEKSGFDINNNSMYIEIYKQFMLENDQCVHLEAMNILGEFIQFLSIQEIEPLYLHFFANSIDEYYSNLRQNYLIESRKDILYPSAFNFSAILYRYGKESWGKLKQPYISLCNDPDDKIKLTLIASFSEIVNILGKDINEIELMSIYDSFLNNNPNIEVSLKANKNLIKVIKNLSNETKRKYLNYFIKIIPMDKNNVLNFQSKIYYNWRDMIKTNDAIDCFFTLFPLEMIYRQVVGGITLFCLDDNAIVRKKCAYTLSKILLYIIDYPNMKDYFDKVKRIITTFGYSQGFYVRQQLCKMCHRLIKNKILYETVLKEILLKLSYDSVKDVRISLAKFCVFILKKKLLEANYLLYDDDFYRIIIPLMEDEVLSVSNIILKRKPQGMTEKKLIEKCNEIKQKDLMKKNNGIEELIESESSNDKWCYFFYNNMDFFVQEFGLSLPLTVIKRKNEDNSSKEDYIRVKIKKDKPKENSKEIIQADPLINDNKENTIQEVIENKVMIKEEIKEDDADIITQHQIPNGNNENDKERFKEITLSDINPK